MPALSKVIPSHRTGWPSCETTNLPKLVETLKERGYHSSISTTYSVDGSFFDGVIQNRLRSHACLNNILIADAVMLSEALARVPETFRRAGRYYAVVPAHVGGCFHPKIFLRLGTDRGLLQIASANATAAGWCRNLELVCQLSWSEGSGHPDAAARRSLIRKAYDYLLNWLAPTPGEAIPAKLRIHSDDAAWLLDAAPNAEPLELHDGSAVDFLLERGDGTDAGILDRLQAFVGGDRIRRIVVVSPYWDSDGQALFDFQDAFGGAPVVVGLNPESGAFPWVDVSQRPIEFATDERLQVDRFAHAKLFLLEGERGDHILAGSANASGAALGRPGIPARNAEACVYRRLAPGSARAALGLTLDQPVERVSIRHAPAASFQEGAHRVPSGTVEIDGRELTWWPAPGCSATDAKVVVGSIAAPVRSGGNGQGFVVLSAKPDLPLVVHFMLADGRETLPVIVHDYNELRAVSPGSYGPLRKLFGEYEGGSCGLLDLAAAADYLFDLPAHLKAPGGGGDRKKESEEHELEFESEEHFRRAVELPRGPGRFASAGAEDPVLHFLRRVGLGCLLGYLDPIAEQRRDQSEAEDVTFGEGGDEGPDAIDGRQAGTDNGRAEEQESGEGTGTPVPDGIFTTEQLTRRQKSLVKALGRFDVWLREVTKDSAMPVDDVPAKVAFMFTLMNEAARLRHTMEDGANLTLMTMVPAGKDRGLSVAAQASRVLSYIWRGLGGNPPLAQRLKHDAPQARIRMEVSAFLQMSRWMITRCLLALEEAGTHLELEQMVEKLAIDIVAATALLPNAADPMEEEADILKLETTAGGEPGRVQAIVGRIGQLAAGVPNIHKAGSRQQRAAPPRSTEITQLRG